MAKKKHKKHGSKDNHLTDQEASPEKREPYDLLISADAREKKEAEDERFEEDQQLPDAEAYDTQRTDGHTYNVRQAIDQGLTYTPPTDPATLPSETDPQGAEIAAGFAPSMEDTNPAEENLPSHVDNNDLDLRDDIYLALRNNSETAHLTNVKVQVDNGIVNLLGTVTTQDDIAIVDDVVNELEGVIGIKNDLQVET